jgi:catechol 2,3-dioxygenase-like lactoylglutathione lyase family enzyme
MRGRSRQARRTGIARVPPRDEEHTVDMKLEAVVVPVSDVDRAKQFYKGLGWREDADFLIDEGFHIIQMTPPGSAASIHFGVGLPPAPPGSIAGLFLAVTDIEAARAELIERGADVSEIFHDAGGGLAVRADPASHAPGPDPDRRSYASYATFDDPDGNTFVLQELTTRLPGR